MEFEVEKTSKNNRRNKPAHEPELVSEFGKIQPQDTKIEEAVLGALMLEKDAYALVNDILKPDCFYDPANKVVYEAIQNLGVQEKPIDMLTVTEQLRNDGTLEQAGGHHLYPPPAVHQGVCGPGGVFYADFLRGRVAQSAVLVRLQERPGYGQGEGVRFYRQDRRLRRSLF